MNPIMSILKHKSSPVLGGKQSTLLTQINQMANGIKSGTVDPKSTALDMLKNMSVDQKKALRQLVPQIKKLGKKMGVTEEHMGAFINELNKQL